MEKGKKKTLSLVEPLSVKCEKQQGMNKDFSTKRLNNKFTSVCFMVWSVF